MTPERFEQWIVCLRWFDSEEDEYLGPFRTRDGAARVRNKLEGDIAARGAQEHCAVYVEPIRSNADLMGFRDEMLSALDSAGYPMRSRS
jgi:hypothetical protein